MTTTLSYELKSVMPILSQDGRWNVLSILILHTNIRSRCFIGMDEIARMATNGNIARATRAKKWLWQHKAYTLVPNDKRVSEETKLPARQHLYELTGTISRCGDPTCECLNYLKHPTAYLYFGNSQPDFNVLNGQNIEHNNPSKVFNGENIEIQPSEGRSDHYEVSKVFNGENLSIDLVYKQIESNKRTTRDSPAPTEGAGSAPQKTEFGTPMPGAAESPVKADDSSDAPKRVNPAEPLFRALAAAFHVDAEKLLKNHTAGGFYWKVANELHRSDFPADRTQELYNYVLNRSRRENWKSFTVAVLAKYAPDFLRDTATVAPPSAARSDQYQMRLEEMQREEAERAKHS